MAFSVKTHDGPFKLVLEYLVSSARDCGSVIALDRECRGAFATDESLWRRVALHKWPSLRTLERRAPPIEGEPWRLLLRRCTSGGARGRCAADGLLLAVEVCFHHHLALRFSTRRKNRADESNRYSSAPARADGLPLRAVSRQLAHVYAHFSNSARAGAPHHHGWCGDDDAGAGDDARAARAWASALPERGLSVTLHVVHE